MDADLQSWETKTCLPEYFLLSSLLYRKARFHPALFAFGIVRHVLVAHRRQFTGSVFAGVSMRIRAIGDNLSVLVGQ